MPNGMTADLDGTHHLRPGGRADQARLSGLDHTG